jgi:hypothetical protein
MAALNEDLVHDRLEAAPRVAHDRWRAWAAAMARHEGLLFGLLIVIHLAPIWAFKYLPTTDGAAHVANADAMRKMHDPSRGVLRHYYYVSHAPSPNLIGHLLLAGLMYVVKPVIAEKLVVSLYIVLLPLGARYAVRAIRRQATPLAYLAFPMIYSYAFAQGFYNFCLSMAVFFFVVGYWIGNRDRLDFRRGLTLAGLALVLYASHLMSLVMACGVVGLLTAWFSGKEYLGADRSLRGRAVKRAVITALALLPWLVLSLRYRPAAGQYPAVDWSLKDDVIGLLQFSSMVSYRANEAWLGGALAAVFAALTAMVLIGKVARRSWSRWDALLLIPAALAAGYFKAHDPASVHFYIPQRLMLYAFLTLLLWLAGQPMSWRVRWAIPPLAGVIALGFVVSHGLKYREFAPQLREFVTAGDQIAPNSTFLPLIFAPRGCDARGKPSSIDVAPFYMAAGYIAARRDAVDLRNYEANTDHFPVRFVPGRNPYETLAVGKGLDTIPPRIDLAKFRAAGGEVDYVMLWGVSDELREDPGTVALYRQLEADYQRMPLPGAKWTELWKRRVAQGEEGARDRQGR